MTGALTPQRKAAIAVMALGPDRAAEVLRGLDDDSVAALAEQLRDLGPVSADEAAAVLRELAGGVTGDYRLPAPGPQYARTLVTQALGPERSAPVLARLERPRPFGWLDGADPDLVAPVLAGQPAAALALLLAQLSPPVAAALLGRLPDELRDDVARRVAGLGQVLPETLAEVETALRAALTPVLATVVHRIRGPEVLAQMLQLTPRESEKAVLQALAQTAPQLAEATREALFTFDDAMSLEPRAMQTLLKAVEVRTLATALVTAADDLRDRVLANMSERARATLLEEIDLVTRANPGEVLAARKSVVQAARGLEESGELDLSRRTDAA